MIILYIPNLEIPTDLGWTHDATDWQVATSPIFRDSDIVEKSMSDTEHLTSITMNIDTPQDTILYARARVICNKGIFEWSNIGVIKVEDFVKITFDYPIPSKITKPVITLDFDKFNLPTTMFTINTGNMSTTSNADLVETTYFITDLDGKPYYFKTTRDDLRSKLVNDIILPENKIYIISASFKSSSGDVSSVATEIAYVKPIPEVSLKTDISNIDVGVDLSLVLNPVNEFKSLDMVIYAAGDNIREELFSGTYDSLSMVIPNTIFSGMETNKILIGFNVTNLDNKETGYKYFVGTLDLTNVDSIPSSRIR